jgi:peptidoglycan/xylan/chitin deacetylase (PgdA/CDA1 family)
MVVRKPLFVLGGIALFLALVFGVLEANRYPVIVHYHTLDKKFASIAPYVAPETFEKQMAFIKKNGYRVVTLDEMTDAIKAGRTPRKTLAITFDDGYADNLVAAEILRKHGFPATIFCVAQRMGSAEGFLTPQQAREMEKTTPVRVGSHTLTHLYLPGQPADLVMREATESKKVLETMLGREIRHLAYPVGGFDDAALAAVKSAGYTAAYTTNRGRGKDIHALKRIKLSDHDLGIKLWAKLSGYFYIGKKEKKGY